MVNCSKIGMACMANNLSLDVLVKIYSRVYHIMTIAFYRSKMFSSEVSEENDYLKEEIKNLKLELEELKARPGNETYLEAKNHFESCI